MLIYMLPILSSFWSETETKLLQYLSSERQQKVMNYVHASDRKLSLYAALTARMGFSQVSGIPVSKLSFSYSTNHKPLLSNNTNYDFSFSHTHNFVLCCISKNGAVGADTEKISAAPFEVMKQVFHPEEIQFVRSAPDWRLDEYFFKIWTRKEAYMKYLGVGLVCDLPSSNILSSAHSLHLSTWKYNDYICSIYSDDLNTYKIKEISEKEIYEYFTIRDFPPSHYWSRGKEGGQKS